MHSGGIGREAGGGRREGGGQDWHVMNGLRRRPSGNKGGKSDAAFRALFIWYVWANAEQAVTAASRALAKTAAAEWV